MLCATDVAIDTWKTIRGNYRRAVIKLSKWTKQSSRSGQQKGKKPRAYKHADALSFLDDVFSFEDNVDSMGVSTPDSSEEEDKSIFQVIIFCASNKVPTAFSCELSRRNEKPVFDVVMLSKRHYRPSLY
jgi:hypothetical protein